MTPNPKTLKTTDAVHEAIVELLGSGFNGAPVVDPITNNLVGCVSAFDFVMMEESGAVLPFDTMTTNGEGVNNNEEMARNARKIVATTVGELVSEPPLTIHVDTPMKDAAELLTKMQKHRLCVLDDDHQLVGILSTSDVMRNIVDNVLQLLPPTTNPNGESSSSLSSNEQQKKTVNLSP
jgi:CBS domain-containing protein